MEWRDRFWGHGQTQDPPGVARTPKDVAKPIEMLQCSHFLFASTEPGQTVADARCEELNSSSTPFDNHIQNCPRPAIFSFVNLSIYKAIQDCGKRVISLVVVPAHSACHHHLCGLV